MKFAAALFMTIAIIIALLSVITDAKRLSTRIYDEESTQKQQLIRKTNELRQIALKNAAFDEEFEMFSRPRVQKPNKNAVLEEYFDCSGLPFKLCWDLNESIYNTNINIIRNF